MSFHSKFTLIFVIEIAPAPQKSDLSGLQANMKLVNQYDTLKRRNKKNYATLPPLRKELNSPGPFHQQSSKRQHHEMSVLPESARYTYR